MLLYLRHKAEACSPAEDPAESMHGLLRAYALDSPPKQRLSLLQSLPMDSVASHYAGYLTECL